MGSARFQLMEHGSPQAADFTLGLVSTYGANPHFCFFFFVFF
jgi:hypothetical protein